MPRPAMLSAVAIGAGTIGLLGCAVTVLIARFLPGGHPPLAGLVGVVTLPLAVLLGAVGLMLVFAGRRSIPRPRLTLAALLDASSIVAGLALWGW